MESSMSLKNGYLKKYFKGIIAKKLSAVETIPKTSNQHEFNATSSMKAIFGNDDRKFRADFLYLSDERTIAATDFLTWYDARRNHPSRTEYRLYYPSTVVSDKATVGDSLFICLKQNDDILCVVGQKDSTITSQLYWLFDINEEKAGQFTLNSSLETDSSQLEFAARTILEQIGIEYEETDEELFLFHMLEEFGCEFPKTRVFSDYARKKAGPVDAIDDPDNTLVKWVNMEEKLFYIFEQHVIKERLKQGFEFGNDVDVTGFIEFSLSVQNRRKARAGLALENHIMALFDANNIMYSHTPITENKSRPDFIFPNIECYNDKNFPAEKLTMLGAKSTCKDRWRQVLAEADRISRKHLLTLEAAISVNQTEEMLSKQLELVVPKTIQETYTKEQQHALVTVSDFLELVKKKQLKEK